MTEAEAQAIHFTIDHYEPRNARPELEQEYANLMYACNECNTRKGDRSPPPDARADGYRFFKADQDHYQQHFRLQGLRVEPISHAGYYTIEALDLNRYGLRRLRELRQRLSECERYVALGVVGLQGYRIDQLPPHLRVTAIRGIDNALATAAKLADDIDSLLRDNARSSLIDPATQTDKIGHDEERLANLKHLEGLYASSWRAPRSKQKKKSKKR